MKAQVLADEIRADQKDQDHREALFDQQEIVIRKRPDLQAKVARAGDHLLVEKGERLHDRFDDVGFAFEQSPDGKHRRQRRAGDQAASISARTKRF